MRRSSRAGRPSCTAQTVCCSMARIESQRSPRQCCGLNPRLAGTADNVKLRSATRHDRGRYVAKLAGRARRDGDSGPPADSAFPTRNISGQADAKSVFCRRASSRGRTCSPADARRIDGTNVGRHRKRMDGRSSSPSCSVARHFSSRRREVDEFIRVLQDGSTAKWTVSLARTSEWAKTMGDHHRDRGGLRMQH